MKKNIYKMLSLDTSSTNSGYAYWENGILKEYGVLNSEKYDDKLLKINDMGNQLIEKLNKYKPQTVVIEMTVVERNAHTQRILSEIVGIVRGWAIINKAEFVQMRPTEWRKYAKEKDEKLPTKKPDLKAWSVNRVKNIYSLKVTDDCSDAILIGLARINMFI